MNATISKTTIMTTCKRVTCACALAIGVGLGACRSPRAWPPRRQGHRAGPRQTHVRALATMAAWDGRAVPTALRCGLSPPPHPSTRDPAGLTGGRLTDGTGAGQAGPDGASLAVPHHGIWRGGASTRGGSTTSRLVSRLVGATDLQPGLPQLGLLVPGCVDSAVGAAVGRLAAQVGHGVAHPLGRRAHGGDVGPGPQHLARHRGQQRSRQSAPPSPPAPPGGRPARRRPARAPARQTADGRAPSDSVAPTTTPTDPGPGTAVDRRGRVDDRLRHRASVGDARAARSHPRDWTSPPARTRRDRVPPAVSSSGRSDPNPRYGDAVTASHASGDVSRPRRGVGRHGRADVTPLGVGEHQHARVAQLGDRAFQHRVTGRRRRSRRTPPGV